jgi:hypothetical protein
VFGFWDWLTIPARTRAKRIGVLHGLVNVIVVGLFASRGWSGAATARTYHRPRALVCRSSRSDSRSCGGWLGGELVERLGIGVSRTANPNATELAPPHAAPAHRAR